MCLTLVSSDFVLVFQNRSILQDDEELGIRILADKQKKELHIIDTGVGMTKKELVTNLGTIAKSGTKEFAKAAKEGDAQVRGQKKKA